MKRLLAVLLLSAAPAGAADTQPEAAPRPVVTVIVDEGTESAITYVGTVVARIEADLGFPLAGTIAERPVSAGDLVAAGEVLARLDPTDLDAALQAAEAGVTVAEAQLRSARDTSGRVEELVRRGVASATQSEDAARALVAAEAQMERARATLVRASDQRGLATLTAPQAGVVTAVAAEPGAAVSAGQAVLTLAGTEAREIVIDLSEADVARFPTGTAFAAVLGANPAIAATAILDRVDPVADRSTRTRRLHLSVAEAPEAFRLGALVRVSVASGAGGGVVLPAAAVRTTSDGTSVWVIDRSDNRAHLTPIRLGAPAGDFVLVTEGVAPGDEVLVRGIHSIEDGQVVGPRVTE
ncbi:MAG: efflux RND transporter periplasmic adaptor subunit [Rhodobacteraceae bacterium]|nr:efflux RND transporter periplasmic adaptor subunit [Paracoccaceae bacterium]